MRVTCTQRLDFRYDGVDMGGHALTVANDNNNCLFFVALTVSNPGDITVERGGFEFQANMSGFTTAQTVTVKSGAYLSLWNASTWQPGNLVLEDGARLKSTNGDYVPGAYTRNIWSGAISVQGTVVADDISSGKQVMLYGNVSGAGGFASGKGGWLQFYNAANTFTGGIGMKSGGVASWGTNSLPVQGGAVALTNANLHLMKSPPYTMTLPDMSFHGEGTVSGKVAYASAKSLAKTGTGVLDIWTPLHVKGALDVQGGGVRLRARVSDAPSGLKWYHANVGGDYSRNDVPTTIPYMGIDQSGVSYAYRSWQSVVTTCHYYTGYIHVPGEEGEDVTCNFASCICRGCHVRIDDTDVVKFADNQDLLSNTTTVNYSRLYVYPKITLKAGWHRIFIEMNNWWNGTSGPIGYNGWPSNYGIGVDWQGRSVTNSANYVKLIDPGDGSFLRSAMTKDEAAADADAYRPTFNGPATFGPGTSIDFGDAAPYVPFVFNGLSGCPAIANGELVVSNSWTVSHAQAAAQPLTVAAGAKLTFAAGTTLAIEDVDLFSRQPAGTPLVVAADADAIMGLPVLTGVGNKWKVEVSDDGKSLVLRDVSGTMLFIR
ncbi:MAG: hypothetical protein IJI36_09625 [Kiritimatiellae bacterium]|nr:hypothetical protein [Kiritimatiellia bacterium]